MSINSRTVPITQDGHAMLPKAKLSDVQNNGEGILKASYMGDCVTLSPAMTREEFRGELRKLEAHIHRVALERNKREATR